MPELGVLDEKERLNSPHPDRSGKRYGSVFEIMIWLILFGFVVALGVREALWEYWIDLTPRACLICDHAIGELSVDHETADELLVSNRPTGGSIEVKGVTHYGVVGTVVVGASKVGWFVLETKQSTPQWEDLRIFTTEAEWRDHLKQMNITPPTLQRPSFADARLSSVGPGCRIVLIVAAGIFMVAFFRIWRMIQPKI